MELESYLIEQELLPEQYRDNGCEAVGQRANKPEPEQLLPAHGIALLILINRMTVIELVEFSTMFLTEAGQGSPNPTCGFIETSYLLSQGHGNNSLDMLWFTTQEVIWERRLS